MFDESTLVDDLVAEVRKHPGIVGGTVAVLAGVGFATLFLRQRTGPRRYEVIKDRLSPRQWADELALSDRLGMFGRRVRDDAADLADVSRERARDVGYDLGERARGIGERARDLADDARDRFDSWRHDRRRRHKRKQTLHSARHAAVQAREFASDHAREGAALLTVALIAAAIGAIALENRKLSGE